MTTQVLPVPSLFNLNMNESNKRQHAYLSEQQGSVNSSSHKRARTDTDDDKDNGGAADDHRSKLSCEDSPRSNSDKKLASSAGEGQKLSPPSAAALSEAEKRKKIIADEKQAIDDIERAIFTFPERLMELLDQGVAKDAMWWLEDGDGFCVIPKVFADKVLNKYFQGTKFESFTRKLNRWGFKRASGQNIPVNTIAYYHNMFQKGKPELIKNMRGGKKKDGNVSEKDKLITSALNSDYSLAGLPGALASGHPSAAMSAAAALGAGAQNLGNVFFSNATASMGGLGAFGGSSAGSFVGMPGSSGLQMPGNNAGMAGFTGVMQGAGGFGNPFDQIDQEMRLQSYLVSQQQVDFALQQQQQQQRLALAAQSQGFSTNDQILAAELRRRQQQQQQQASLSGLGGGGPQDLTSRILLASASARGPAAQMSSPGSNSAGAHGASMQQQQGATSAYDANLIQYLLADRQRHDQERRDL